MVLLVAHEKKNYRGVLKKVKKKEANKQTKIKNREIKKKKKEARKEKRILHLHATPSGLLG